MSAFDNLVLRLKAEMLADKKKSALMGGLLAVALFLGVKATIGSKGPKKAHAATVAAAQSESSVAVAPAPTAVSVSSKELDEYLRSVDSRVCRDLFQAELDAYPKIIQDDLAETLNKSASKQADDAVVLARMKQEAAIRELAGALDLQSTMAGKHPTAVINGQVVARGQMIEGFTVREIHSGSCVVTRGEVKIKLTMAR